MSKDLIEEKDKSLRLQIDVETARSQRQIAEKRSIRLTQESEEIKSSLTTQVQSLREAVKSKGELLALKDQRINQLRSELFKGKTISELQDTSGIMFGTPVTHNNDPFAEHYLVYYTATYLGNPYLYD